CDFFHFVEHSYHDCGPLGWGARGWDDVIEQHAENGDDAIAAFYSLLRSFLQAHHPEIICG
nr:hypothetical protein [Clostridiales bacterium]